jgi:hypothetical protein
MGRERASVRDPKNDLSETRMKLTAIVACTFLLLGATSAFAQDRSTEDTQGKNAAPDPATNGTGATKPSGNTTQNSNALQSGHAGEAGAQPTMKQCQDLTALEAKSPNMQRDPVKDKACAQILGKGTADGTGIAVSQNKNAATSGHDGADGTLLTKKQCQDLTAQEAKNPNLQRDPAKDRRCARLLGTTPAP